jgi:hypothetical protein
MRKAPQRKKMIFLKRKRDETSKIENPLATTNDSLPLLQLEQKQHNHDEGFQTNEPVSL